MSSAPGTARAVDATVTVDAQGSFLSVSQGFLELIGAPVERLAGSNIVDHLHPDDAATVWQLLAAAARGVASVAIMVEVFDAAGVWAAAELSFEHGEDDRLTLGLRAMSAGAATTSASTSASTPVEDIDPATERSGPAETSGGLVGWLRGPFRPAPTEPTPTEPTPTQPTPTQASRTQPMRPPAPDSVSSSADAGTERAGAGDAATVALPGAVDDDLPYDDSPEHLGYVASIPDDDIVDRRAAARAAAGPADAPMLEIDGHGRTVYVSGSWADLGEAGATGVEVFEQLLERSGAADAVLQSVDEACGSSRAGRHALHVGGLPPRWIQVVPIPSPHLASETHALVSIVTESELRGSGE